MSRVLGLCVSTVALVALTGCDGRVKIVPKQDVALVRSERGPLKTIARLDCPETAGALKRTAVGADGATCAYADDRGAVVDLKLIPLSGLGAESVLAQEQAALKALMPPDPEGETQADADGDIDVDTGGESAHVRLPGVSIEAEDDNASIRVGGGLSIDAHGGGETVQVRSTDERFDIRQHNGVAEVVADASKDGEVRSTYILAEDDAESAGPWRVAGYEARAPQGGPLVIAVVRAKERKSDRTFDAMKALLERNVGG